MVVVIILSCVLHNLGCVGHIWGAELRFTQDRVGKAHVRHVVATCEPTPIVTKCGDEGWSYIGPTNSLRRPLSSPGVRSPSVTVRLPQGLNAKLDHEAARTGKRRSEIVREALEAALA